MLSNQLFGVALGGAAQGLGPANQSVKPRATLGGETAITVNNHLRTTLTKAYSNASKEIPIFLSFRKAIPGSGTSPPMPRKPAARK